MATCGEHSGICANMTNCEKQIEELETQQKQKMDSAIFWKMVGVLTLLFSGMFGMHISTNASISRIEASTGVQAVHIQHMQSDIKDIKAGLK